MFELEDHILQKGGYTLPTDGMSVTCPICSKPCFIVMTRYQGVKIKPGRCLGCVIRFPPRGVTFTFDDYVRKRPWLKRTIKYHQWGLMAQTPTEDVWTCLHCKSVLHSPKLGIPAARGCHAGITQNHRRTFWAHNRIPSVRCPLCARRASLLRVPRLLEVRPSSKFFPWTCRTCLVSS